MGIFDIVSIDVRLILLNFAATNVYELFTKSVKKICNLNDQNERGGGINGIFNNFKKH